jgi:phage portal protein BeeE
VEPEKDARLLSAFWALHAATIRRDGLDARMRAGQLDEDTLERSLSAAESVLAARTALYRQLMSMGWTPPDEVVRDVEYDEIVLSEDDSSIQLG